MKYLNALGLWKKYHQFCVFKRQISLGIGTILTVAPRLLHSFRISNYPLPSQSMQLTEFVALKGSLTFNLSTSTWLHSHNRITNIIVFFLFRGKRVVSSHSRIHGWLKLNTERWQFGVYYYTQCTWWHLMPQDFTTKHNNPFTIDAGNFKFYIFHKKYGHWINGESWATNFHELSRKGLAKTSGRMLKKGFQYPWSFFRVQTSGRSI